MSTTELRPPIRIFSTCPPSSDYPSGDAYRSKVTQVARWSEAAGCEGILVYTDNRLADPWVVSQLIVEATESLAPLVAVQPIYAHPYTVAKAIASFAYLYGRRLHLNMVAGGFKRDLAALDDPTPHDERYLRLIEYTGIVMKLLRSTTPVSFHGQYYGLEQLKLAPALEGHLLPDVFVSGSSAAGMEAAHLLDATAVKYPRSAAEEESASGTEDAGPLGIRVGVLARQTDEEAWSEAHARFPGDRRGELLHGIAMKVSDSEWHRQLSESSKGDREGPYWLFPFQCYKTFCPYLVGSYYRVAGELARYMEQGVRTFILDVPLREDDLKHANFTFELALEVAVR